MQSLSDHAWVTLSERLSDGGREAFTKAFAIVTGDSAVVRPEDSHLIYDFDSKKHAPYSIPDNLRLSGFAFFVKTGSYLNAKNTDAVKATWNTDGTEATFYLNLPLRARRDEACKYYAVVSTPFERIEDGAGNQLGTNMAGDFSSSEPGTLIHNAFKNPELAGDTWQATHSTATPLTLRADTMSPKLEAVAAVTEGPDVRLLLTFSEPMATYYGPGLLYFDESIVEPKNYRFKLGPNRDELKNSALKTVATFQIDLSDTIKAPDLPSGENIDLTFTCPDETRAQHIQVDSAAPKVVGILIKNGKSTGLLEAFNGIWAQVESVRDPAGNAISSGGAGEDFVTGAI
jgi:hypothetical protein